MRHVRFIGMQEDDVKFRSPKSRGAIINIYKRPIRLSLMCSHYYYFVRERLRVLIMLKVIILVTFLAVVAAEYHSYRPSGWRPVGRPFEPTHNDRLQTYGIPPLSHPYGSPISRPAYHPLPEETTTTTTTTTETPTTTTPRSREPTTSPDLGDEDFDGNPALAIANSFAFNRPVYVYNTFPFHPGLTFVK